MDPLVRWYSNPIQPPLRTTEENPIGAWVEEMIRVHALPQDGPLPAVTRTLHHVGLGPWDGSRCMQTLGTYSDCLIHSFLYLLSEPYRRCRPEDKSFLGYILRRKRLASQPEYSPAHQALLASEEFLDDEVAHSIGRTAKVSVIFVIQQPKDTYLWMKSNSVNRFIVIEGNQYHFQAVVDKEGNAVLSSTDMEKTVRMVQQRLQPDVPTQAVLLAKIRARYFNDWMAQRAFLFREQLQETVVHDIHEVLQEYGAPRSMALELEDTLMKEIPLVPVTDELIQRAVSRQWKKLVAVTSNASVVQQSMNDDITRWSASHPTVRSSLEALRRTMTMNANSILEQANRLNPAAPVPAPAPAAASATPVPAGRSRTVKARYQQRTIEVNLGMEPHAQAIPYQIIQDGMPRRTHYVMPTRKGGRKKTRRNKSLKK